MRQSIASSTLNKVEKRLNHYINKTTEERMVNHIRNLTTPQELSGTRWSERRDPDDPFEEDWIFGRYDPKQGRMVRDWPDGHPSKQIGSDQGRATVREEAREAHLTELSRYDDQGESGSKNVLTTCGPLSGPIPYPRTLAQGQVGGGAEQVGEEQDCQPDDGGGAEATEGDPLFSTERDEHLEAEGQRKTRLLEEVRWLQMQNAASDWTEAARVPSVRGSVGGTAEDEGNTSVTTGGSSL
jgi:uncharacterized protein YciI